MRPSLRQVLFRSNFNPFAQSWMIDGWDAEDASKLTLVGSEVSAFASSKNNYSAVQTVSTARPIYGATSFNGRPGVTFDGIDDELTMTGVGAFPVGVAPCEMWALIDQTTPAATSGSLRAFSYGGADSGGRSLYRGVGSGVNRARTIVGGTLSPDGSIDFTGKHVVRSVVTGTTLRTDVDGIVGTSIAVVPVTLSQRLRMGASAGSGAASFLGFVGNFFAITDLLNDTQAADLTAYLKARGGIA